MTLRCVTPSCSDLSLYYDIIHTMGEQSNMLMWFMSEAKGVERPVEGWTRRLLSLDFTSIQSYYFYCKLQRTPFF